MVVQSLSRQNKPHLVRSRHYLEEYNFSDLLKVLLQTK